MSTSTKHTLVTTDQPEDNANSQEKTKPIVSAKDQLHYLDIRYRDEKIKKLTAQDWGLLTAAMNRRPDMAKDRIIRNI